MALVISLVSIIVIVKIVWLFNKILPFKICPICAGVSGTWIWILVALYAELLAGDDWKLTVAILMGASIAGIAYQLEKRLPKNRSPLIWKILFIPAGFAAAYGLLSSWWLATLISCAFLALVTIIFLKSPQGPSGAKEDTIKKIEKQMEKCC